MSEKKASRFVEVLAGAALTFALNIVLALIGWIATDSSDGQIPSSLMFASFFWLLSLAHVVPSAIAAALLRRYYAVPGMLLSAALCSVPSFLAMSLTWTVAGAHV
ncbi:MAG: hypothetical protein M5U28_08430 [Sandaracinaceae bacterium]|nr:hypothetical protein [Sandaracinaceae bacterium]